MYYTNDGINLYKGDKQVGDRVATEQEVNYFKQKQLVKSKEEQLNSLIITTSTGKRFYADPDSRTDLVDVVLEGIINNMPDEYTTEWKTASRPEGTNFETVTFAELKEAKRLALEAKGQIVGVN